MRHCGWGKVKSSDVDKHQFEDSASRVVVVVVIQLEIAKLDFKQVPRRAGHSKADDASDIDDH